jgi:hypothetical protein
MDTTAPLSRSEPEATKGSLFQPGRAFYLPVPISHARTILRHLQAHHCEVDRAQPGDVRDGKHFTRNESRSPNRVRATDVEIVAKAICPITKVASRTNIAMTMLPTRPTPLRKVGTRSKRVCG